MDAEKRGRSAAFLTVDNPSSQSQIVAPTVVRRPTLDIMLSDVSYIAKGMLADMRIKQDGNDPFTAWEIRQFKDICELVLKQARLEMAVEKHVDERTAGLRDEEITQDIVKKLESKGIRNNIIDLVLEALGLVH